MQDGKNPRKRQRRFDEIIDVDALTGAQGTARKNEVSEVVPVVSAPQPAPHCQAYEQNDVLEIVPVHPTRPRPLPHARADGQDDILEIVPISAPPRLLPESDSKRGGPSRTQQGDLENDELLNPSVGVVELFRKYNHQYFWSKLQGVFVEFSNRMTSCAGTCTFRGKLGGCRIALSEPLLKFRPRSDLLSTLLHEMIHAYLFLTEGIAARDGFDGHGPKFLSHASRINMGERGRVNITPYHSFIDEVNLYRVHHWKCTKCRLLIKRAMNRAPAPRDRWWPRHKMQCGGDFIKIKEPPKKEKKPKWKKPKNFHGVVAVDPNDKSSPKPPPGVMRTQRIENLLCNKPSTAPCPVCGKQIVQRLMNEHLDECLSGGCNTVEPSDEIQEVVHLDTSVPLSGRLFMERLKGSSSRTCLGKQQGDRNEVESSEKHGESVPIFNSCKPSGEPRVRSESINECTMSSAIQTIFGSTNVLLDYAIRGIPVKLPQSDLEKKGTNFLSELSAAADRVPIMSFSSEQSHASMLEKYRLQVGLQSLQNLKPKIIENMHSAREPSELRAVHAKTSFASNCMNDQSTAPTPRQSRLPWLTEQEAMIIGNTARPTNQQTRTAISKAADVQKAACPFCSASMLRSELDGHVSICLVQTGIGLDFETESAVEPQASKQKQSVQIGKLQSSRTCTEINDMPTGETPHVSPNLELTQCPFCDRQLPRSELSKHTAVCLVSMVPDPELIPCPFCDRPFARNELDRHTSKCIVSMGLMNEF